MIMDKKELFNETYEPELREIIRREIGRKFSTYLWPKSGSGYEVSAGIPDNRDLKLVILRPDDDDGGPVFDSQMVLFSIVKVQARCPKWPSFR